MVGMERSTAALRVPTVPVPVELALAGDMRLRVQLFVGDRARAGRTQLALDLAAMLDGDPPFVPAREPGGHVVLYAKAGIAWVAVGLADAPGDGPAAGDEPSEVTTLYEQQHDVEVVIDRGTTLVGHVLYTAPPDRQRVVDHLNQPGPFLRLWTSDHLYVIGKRHVVRVREI
jgi:hypothetical protein